jgi:hypothetical protein
VPITFYANGIIGLDGVDDLGLLRKLNRKFALASAHGIRAADLVIAARPQKVDVSKVCFRRRRGTVLWVRSTLGEVRDNCVAKTDYVIVAAGYGKVAKPSSEVLLPTETSEPVAPRESRLRSRFQVDFAFDWK